MSDIELIIKISEEDYEIMKYNIAVNNPLCPLSQKEIVYKIASGVPLAKRHGDLVDYEELKNNAREHGMYAKATLSHIKPKIIIGADKESVDADSN